MACGVDCLSRLQRDLKELRQYPIPNVGAQPLESNLREWHVNLLPTEGPYTGLLTHMKLLFPETYPHEPPKVELCVPLQGHPNVFHGWYGADDVYICLDMLRASHAKGQGWSAAYSVRSLLMQLYGFLMVDDNIDQDWGGRNERGGLTKRQKEKCFDLARKFVCSACHHCWDEPFPAVHEEEGSAPTRCSTALQVPMSALLATARPARHRQPTRPSPAAPTASTQQPAKPQPPHQTSHNQGAKAEAPATAAAALAGGGAATGGVPDGPSCPGAAAHPAASSGQPPQAQAQPPAARAQPCFFHAALDDALLTRVLEWLAPEDLSRCQRVDRRTACAAQLVLRQSELTCYFSRMGFPQATLGYGVVRQFHQGGSRHAGRSQQPHSSSSPATPPRSDRASGSRHPRHSPPQAAAAPGGGSAAASQLRSLHSPMELVSWEAYSSGLRKSVWNEPFEQFLPLYLNPSHGQRALALLPACVRSILDQTSGARQPQVPSNLRAALHPGAAGHGGSSAVTAARGAQAATTTSDMDTDRQDAGLLACRLGQRQAGGQPARQLPMPAGDVLLVVAQLINSLVVDMVGGGGGSRRRQHGGADDPAAGADQQLTRGMCDASLSAFCHLHHLLLALAVQPGSSVAAEARAGVAAFMSPPSERHKSRCPDLGLLLVKYLLTPKSMAPWSRFAPLVLRETLARQVLWAVRQDDRFGVPHLDQGESGDAERLRRHFDVAATSLRLLMVQAWFANAVARPATPQDLSCIKRECDLRLGMPSPAKFHAFGRHARAVLRVHDWCDFLRGMRLGFNLKLQPRQAMLGMLRQAVVDSLHAGYHREYSEAEYRKLRGAVFMDWARDQPVGAYTQDWE